MPVPKKRKRIDRLSSVRGFGTLNRLRGTKIGAKAGLYERRFKPDKRQKPFLAAEISGKKIVAESIPGEDGLRVKKGEFVDFADSEAGKKIHKRKGTVRSPKKKHVTLFSGKGVEVMFGKGLVPTYKIKADRRKPVKKRGLKKQKEILFDYKKSNPKQRIAAANNLINGFGNADSFIFIEQMMIQDPKPGLRRQASDFFWQVANRKRTKRPTVEKILRILNAAAEKETDSATRLYIKQHVQVITHQQELNAARKK